MCGLVGLVGKGEVAPDIYDALTVLQHRGQDAAGIITCSGGRFNQRKSEGLVRDVEGLIPEIQVLSDEVAAALIASGGAAHEVYIASRQMLLL